MKILAITATLLLASLTFAADAPSTVPATQSSAPEVFNGKDLTGWSIQAKSTWTVDNGELVGKQEGTPTIDSWLFTDAEFDNFKLELDFKIPAEANTGVALRMPKEKKGDPDMNGYEFQICNIKGKPTFGSLIHKADLKTGAIYKPDEWNHLTITLDGPHITATLNGEKILDTQQKSGPKTGRIGFQVAKGKDFAAMEYRFKNIKLTPLTAP